jgi:hypothetical protein
MDCMDAFRHSLVSAKGGNGGATAASELLPSKFQFDLMIMARIQPAVDHNTGEAEKMAGRPNIWSQPTKTMVKNAYIKVREMDLPRNLPLKSAK